MSMMENDPGGLPSNGDHPGYPKQHYGAKRTQVNIYVTVAVHHARSSNSPGFYSTFY